MRRSAPVTYWLIVSNIVTFLALVFGSSAPDLVYIHYGLVPFRLLHEPTLQEVSTVFSSMFLHGGFWHLAGNMIFLGVFGRLAEEHVGHRSFLTLYMVSGVGAALAQILWDPASLVPMVGASGAISGALGAAVVLEPRRRLFLITPFTLFFPITLSVWAFGVLWFVLQIFGGLGAEAAGVAFWAHVGGFVVGFGIALAARRAHKRPTPPSGYGPAPDGEFRTYWITDARGRTYEFHEPVHRT